MKIVLIFGSHPRHLYFMNALIKTGLVCGAVMQEREGMLSDIPAVLSDDLKKIYKYHFDLRLEMENRYFGSEDKYKFMRELPSIIVPEARLNSGEVENFIQSVGADVIISYGPGLIKDNILDLVNGQAFNLHGGLSPWYKGSATMFWPFYFLEPNYVGTTFHYVTKRIDGGKIVHHSVPRLEKDDCMHEVACKAIVQASKDIPQILLAMNSGKIFEGIEQKKNGKLFLDKDWRPEHLKLIYETYEDKIVDLYLEGKINQGNEPTLINGLDS